MNLINDSYDQIACMNLSPNCANYGLFIMRLVVFVFQFVLVIFELDISDILLDQGSCIGNLLDQASYFDISLFVLSATF